MRGYSVKLPRRPLTRILIEETDKLPDGVGGRYKLGLSWPFSILVPGRIVVRDLSDVPMIAHELQHAIDATHPIGTVRKLALSFVGRETAWTETRGEAQEAIALGHITNDSGLRIARIRRCNYTKALAHIADARKKLKPLAYLVEPDA